MRKMFSIVMLDVMKLFVFFELCKDCGKMLRFNFVVVRNNFVVIF